MDITYTTHTSAAQILQNMIRVGQIDCYYEGLDAQYTPDNGPEIAELEARSRQARKLGFIEDDGTFCFQLTAKGRAFLASKGIAA